MSRGANARHQSGLVHTGTTPKHKPWSGRITLPTHALALLLVDRVLPDSDSFGRTAAAVANVPNGQFLFLSLGMFSCAHVRANYFSIGRVFDCSRQSSSVSRSTKQARHVRLFGRYHNLCPHLGREKSGSGKRGERRSARPPDGRIMHKTQRRSRSVLLRPTNSGHTIRHLTDRPTRHLSLPQMRERGRKKGENERGAKKQWPANPFPCLKAQKVRVCIGRS